MPASVRPKGGARQLTLPLEREQSKYPPASYWTVLTSNRKLNKGGTERQEAAPGENSCVVAEVGTKNDAEQRVEGRGLHRSEETVGSTGEIDKVQTASELARERSRAGEIIARTWRCGDVESYQLLPESRAVGDSGELSTRRQQNWQKHSVSRHVCVLYSTAHFIMLFWAIKVLKKIK